MRLSNFAAAFPLLFLSIFLAASGDASAQVFTQVAQGSNVQALSAVGFPAPGESLTYTVCAPESAYVIIGFGATQISTSYVNGYVVHIQASSAFASFIVQSDANGTANFNFIVPMLPPGQFTVAQALIYYPDGGFALTNAVTMTTQSLAPVATLPLGPSATVSTNVTNAATVTVTGVASFPGQSVHIDGGATRVCLVASTGPSGTQFSGVVPLRLNAVNNLHVAVVDENGVKSAPTVLSVVQDQTPPELFIDFPAAGVQPTTSAINVSGRIGDPLSGFMGISVTVQVIGGATKSATTYPGVGTNGTFDCSGVVLNAVGVPTTIVVSATDALQNVVSKSVTVTQAALTGAQMTALSGSGQSGAVMSQLAQPIVVRLNEANGMPFVNKVVTFRVVRSDGRLSTSSGGAGSSMLQVMSDAAGMAQAFWTLGNDAGAGNNRVEVSSNGISGTVFFCASATPGPAAQINIVNFATFRSEVGALTHLPLSVWVNDACNGVPGVPVTFTIKSGGGVFPSGGTTELVTTGITGHAEVSLILGPNPGNNVVEADFAGNANDVATFTVVGVGRNPASPTKFSGLVVDNSQAPIGGARVTLTVTGQPLGTVTTDAQGRFEFASISETISGPGHLFVNGRVANLVNGQSVPTNSFPNIEFAVLVIPQVENRLDMPVNLPRLDPANEVTFTDVLSVAGDVVLTCRGVAGLKMIVKQGTTITLADGVTKIGPGFPGSVKLSLNQVHFDDIPMRLPDGAAPPLALTLQPGGTSFDKPVSIEYPNMAGLPPGAVAYFMSFNHDTIRFDIVGSGTVTADGSTIVQDPGGGITHAGWHGSCPPYAVTGGVKRGPNGDLLNPFGDPSAWGADDDVPTDQAPPDGPRPCSNGGAAAHGGSEQKGGGSAGGGSDKTDPIYLFSGEYYDYVTDMRIKGRGFDFVWERSYRSKIGVSSAQGVNWDFSYNRSISHAPGLGLYLRDGRNRLDKYIQRLSGVWGRSEFFNSLRILPSQQFSLTEADRTQWNFNGFKLSSSDGKLASIVDRNGNTMTFSYDAQGRLVTIMDTLGRPITVSYNAQGYIAAVTDFTGRAVTYTYYDGTTSGGSAGDLQSASSPAVVGTPNGNDFPNGKTTTYTYSAGFADERLNHNLLTITDGRRNDPNDPTFGQGPYLTNVYAATQNPNDFEFDRIERQVWGGGNIDLVYVPQNPTATNLYVRTKTILRDRVGNVSEMSFDQKNRLVLKREYTGRSSVNSPVTETTNRPTQKLRATDPDYYDTQYVWNSESLLRKTVHPNGNDEVRVYVTDLDPFADQRAKSGLRRIIRRPGAHSPAGDQSSIEEQFEYAFGFTGCCGLQFVSRHVDGRGNETLHEYDVRGNRTKTTHRIASIIEDFEYNAFGQRTAHVLPDNGSGSRRRDEMTYYSSGPQTGYLQSEIVDVAGFALTTNYEYDQRGNVVRMIDARGNDTLWTVNALDQVVRQRSRPVSGTGNVRYEVDLAHDANNNLTKVDVQNVNDQGSVGSNTHFTLLREYDVLDHIVKETREVDPTHNVVTEYDYDLNRNLTLFRKGGATSGSQPTNTVTRVYDERSLVYRVIRAAGDPFASTTQTDYDGNQNPVVILEGIESSPRITVQIFDGYDRRIGEVDPMSNSKVWNYDANGNLVHERVDGELIDLPGNSANVRLSEWSDAYDVMDRLVRRDTAFFKADDQSAIAGGFSTWQAFYSDNSQIRQIINPNSHSTTYAYDTANRLALVTDAKSNSVAFGYDANSNVTSVTSTEIPDLGGAAEVFATTASYDGLDRLIRAVDSSGNVNERAYDSRDNVTLTLDAKRAAPSLPGNMVRMNYDGLNRLLSTVRTMTSDGTGAGTPIGTITTTQSFDDSSRLIAQTDDNGHTTSYGYDSLDRRTSTTFADGTMTVESFDVHDNAVTMTDANANVVMNSYDVLDRLTQRTITVGPGVSNDTTFETYAYDGLDRLRSAVDDDSTVVLSYDSLGHIITDNQSGRAVNCTFDAAGNRTICFYPGGRVITTIFDALERPSMISDQSGLIATYAYVGPDRVQRREYGNGTRTDYSYDGIAGVPNPPGDFGSRKMTRTRHTRVSDGSVIDDRTYTWDPMMNKTQRKDLTPGGALFTHDYGYDSVHRMVSSTQTGLSIMTPLTTSYLFDGVGNRIAVADASGTTTYAQSSAQPGPNDAAMNQYTSVSLGTRTYDNNGNRIGVFGGVGPNLILEYDFSNRLVLTVAIDGSWDSRYSYDAIGRRMRVRDSVGGVVLRDHELTYQSWLLLQEESVVSGSYLKTMVYGVDIDECLTYSVAGGRRFLLSDDLFSVVALLSDAGGIVESYEYSDFGGCVVRDMSGAVVVGVGIENNYRFHGRLFDDRSQLYDFRHRFMDVADGRFIQRDPMGIWHDPIGMGSSTTFVGNNPMTLRDPYGLSFLDFVNKDHLIDIVNWIISLGRDAVKKSAGCDGGIVRPPNISPLEWCIAQCGTDANCIAGCALEEGGGMLRSAPWAR